MTTRRLEQLVRLLDSAFRIPGTRWRFGLDAIIGLVPGLGDVVTAGVSLTLLFAAYHQRVPAIIIGRMLLNVLGDLAIGALPFVGDVGDFIFKSNERNLDLLKRHAHGARPPRAIDRIVVLGAVLIVIVAAGSGVWVCWRILGWLFPRPL